MILPHSKSGKSPNRNKTNNSPPVSTPNKFENAVEKLQARGLLRLDCSRPDARAWISPSLWNTNDARWKENVTQNLAAYCHPKYPSIYILDAQSGRDLASFGPLEGFNVK